MLGQNSVQRTLLFLQLMNSLAQLHKSHESHVLLCVHNACVTAFQGYDYMGKSYTSKKHNTLIQDLSLDLVMAALIPKPCGCGNR